MFLHVFGMDRKVIHVVIDILDNAILKCMDSLCSTLLVPKHVIASMCDLRHGKVLVDKLDKFTKVLGDLHVEAVW